MLTWYHLFVFPIFFPDIYYKNYEKEGRLVGTELSSGPFHRLQFTWILHGALRNLVGGSWLLSAKVRWCLLAEGGACSRTFLLIGENLWLPAEVGGCKWKFMVIAEVGVITGSWYL